jgi:PAS domain S-box-containing protein
MLITEQAETAGKRFEVKVFATDAQEDNLRKARDGIYPAAALAGFPPERVRRFFEKLDGNFQVSKELRDMVVFAAQNLLRDPPFSRLDIVSCRNFLIYLEPEAQQRVIAQYHFALRPGGHLFLGNAETIGRHDDLFETVSKKWRIYRRIGPTRHDLIDYRPPSGSAGTRAAGEPSPMPPEAGSAPIADIARRALLERYAPASVLIDQKGRVVYFHGTTRDYLEQPPGEPTKELLAMARDGLALKLRAAIREASKSDRSVTAHARLLRGGTSRDVAMTVMPLPASPQGGKLALVSFAPEPPTAGSNPPMLREDAGETSAGERALQEELASTRTELRSTIEHLETANEELKASNEEATSMNEELQSTNEELETSKEELQSFNEELNTVNSQLQHKIAELERASNDLNNLLAGSETATLFLDDKLAISWFAPATKELFDLVASDIGRPIAHFARKFSDENLLSDAETVLRKLTTIEAEIPSDAGRWYLRRMLPYRTRDNHIAGVVVTFSDITELRNASEAVNDARIYAEAIVRTVRQPLLVLDAELRVRSANPAFYELFEVTKKATEGRLLYDLGEGQWDIPALRTLLGQVLPESQEVADYEVEHEFPGLGLRSMLLNARKLSQGRGRDELVLLAIEDITERKRADVLGQRLAAVVEFSDDAILSKTPDGTITSWNMGAERLFGYAADEILGKSIMTLVPQDLRDEEADILGRIRRGEHIRHYETRRQRKDGSVIWVSLTISPILDAAGKIVGASKIARDMTERRRADEHRKTLMAELNHRVKNTMAVIQSIASQTLGHASTLEEARAAFGSRLVNLAKAHDVLTRESWQSANLADIVAQIAEPHAGGKNRIRIEGPDLRLSPSAALAFSMALHELGTNAAKYGALSSKSGQVAIAWRIEGKDPGRRLVLHWEESGGPPVARPTRKGFGSRLIERALAAELGGEVRVDYESSGLRCAIVAPLPDGQGLPGGQGDRGKG